MYRSEVPDDQAEVRSSPLIIDGRTVIPEFWMAITHGEAAAIPVPGSRSDALELQITKIAKADKR